CPHDRGDGPAPEVEREIMKYGQRTAWSGIALGEPFGLDDRVVRVRDGAHSSRIASTGSRREAFHEGYSVATAHSRNTIIVTTRTSVHSSCTGSEFRKYTSPGRLIG